MTALALGSSPSVRNEIRRSLRDSRHTVEHKLHFQKYLSEQKSLPRGQAKLINAMAEANGITADSVLRIVNSVLELEFYLPVQEQRSQWRGGRDMVVVSLLDDSDELSAFDLDGLPLTLETWEIPDATMLSIVPVETDFSKELPASYINTGDEATIGTYQTPRVFGVDEYCAPDDFECEGDDDPPGGGSSLPRGLYYTASNLDGVGEAIAKGRPEIEAYVFDFFDPHTVNYGDDIWDEDSVTSPLCDAGNVSEHTGLRKFDQNNEDWYGNAMLLDGDQLQDFLA